MYKSLFLVTLPIVVEPPSNGKAFLPAPGKNEILLTMNEHVEAAVEESRMDRVIPLKLGRDERLAPWIDSIQVFVARSFVRFFICFILR